MGKMIEKWGGKEDIFTVPRGKNIISGNRGRGKYIIFLVNIHTCWSLVSMVCVHWSVFSVNWSLVSMVCVHWSVW